MKRKKKHVFNIILMYYIIVFICKYFYGGAKSGISVRCYTETKKGAAFHTKNHILNYNLLLAVDNYIYVLQKKKKSFDLLFFYFYFSY